MDLGNGHQWLPTPQRKRWAGMTLDGITRCWWRRVPAPTEPESDQTLGCNFHFPGYTGNRRTCWTTPCGCNPQNPDGKTQTRGEIREWGGPYTERDWGSHQPTRMYGSHLDGDSNKLDKRRKKIRPLGNLQHGWIFDDITEFLSNFCRDDLVVVCNLKRVLIF